ncbi:alpha/beta fold hydrolase [Kribbella sp. NPDC023855]|uniref:alpha/beta fold hydrolase n=1 Tax=Kribbella sp. NPDC023855 TaxID=3154698 RepID=UPI0033C30956
MKLRLATAVTALLGGLLTLPATAASAAPPPGGLPGITVPTVRWADCGDGWDCTQLQVPLDYRNPSAGTFPLAVTRKKATTANRIGALVVNPGGPGGSAIEFAHSLATDSPLNERFDLAAFDPRGVGQSGSLSCWTAREYSDHYAQAYGRAGTDEFFPAAASGKAFVDACNAKYAKLLPYLGTEFTARDMDLVRAALGEEKITYYGQSFGTFIGTVYANLFPQRLRLAALDGGYDPDAYTHRPYEADRRQYLAADAAMKRFFRWCDATPTECPFGNGNAEGAFVELQQRLDNDPVRTADGREIVNGAMVALRFNLNLGVGKWLWPELGNRLRDLTTKTGVYATEMYQERTDYLTQNTVVECADRGFTRNLRILQARLYEHATAAPILGPATAYAPPNYDHGHATACEQWTDAQKSRYTGPWNASGSPDILVVGVVGDPDTPYQDSVTLSDVLDNGHLLTTEGEGHTGWYNSACAQSATIDYLTNGTLPAPGTTCPNDTP